MQTVRRLLENFKPSHYTLRVDLTDAHKRHFNGTATITGTVPKGSSEIVLHNAGLGIRSATVNGVAARWHVDEAATEMTLEPPTPLTASEYVLVLEFSGTITDPMHGLYPCYFTIDGKQKELFATQFESHHAREVFPCVDEPAAKATFDLTLLTHQHLTVVGNTPVTSQHTSDDGHQVTTFATTPKMSTYLLAFVVGEMHYTETKSANGVLVRAYATPDKVEQTRFALDLTARTLDLYDEYFGLPYPLPKCDIVALPDFSSAAMENWGLITFREAYLLFDDSNTPADTKQYIALVICHELAHQWFGNLVTMEWWDDLWLNESFANWMEYYGVNHFYPEWQIWEQYTGSEQQIALNRDSLASVQSVQLPVHHPDELSSVFDPSIVYAKGGSLIRMLNEYLGTHVFRDGLRMYMQRHQYGNTRTVDLWHALGEISGQDVAGFMDNWIHQPGHPVVTVGVHDTNVTLHQRRFYANPLRATEHSGTIWHVPLLSDSLNEEVMTSASANLTVTNTAVPLRLNQGGTGFYHAHYSREHLHAIATLVGKNKLALTERQRLLFDNLALAKAGLTTTTNLLDLLAHYSKEDNYPVWVAMTSAIQAVKMLISDEETLKPHLQRYVINIANEEFARLGWEPAHDESYFDYLLRPLVIGLMVYGEQRDVLAHTLALFDAAKKPDDLPADIRSIIYSAAVRHQGAPAFDRLQEWYTTASADERTNICAGMTNMRDPALTSRALAFIKSSHVKLQDVLSWFIYSIRNPVSRDATWQWMQDEWPWIEKNFKKDHHYTGFPRYSAGSFGTRAHLESYRAFFTPKMEEASLRRSIEQGIEDIETRALWCERDLKSLADFLRKH